MSSTATNKHATVSRHTGKLPTFHRGEITALACSEFQDACTNYFAHKDTAAEKQVSIVLGCFEDMKVNNWTCPVVQRKRLTALSFPDFMGEFRKKFLKANWMEATRAEVLSSRMKAAETFDEWATNLQSLSALLSDEASVDAVKLDDKRLRHTLEAGMLPDLSHRYYLHPTASKISDDKFDEWLHAVVEIDEARQYEDDHIAAALHAADRGKRKAPVPPMTLSTHPKRSSMTRARATLLPNHLLLPPLPTPPPSAPLSPTTSASSSATMTGAINAAASLSAINPPTAPMASPTRRPTRHSPRPRPTVRRPPRRASPLRSSCPASTTTTTATTTRKMPTSDRQRPRRQARPQTLHLAQT
ncbi:hypothetical protein FB451DRAFT_671505 [Mycena latifolia]|nr:hypothetical protein FB451DRAFT_671505 [Mycena latifolia]